jgi:chromate reductase
VATAPTTLTLIGISGSLRRESFNTRLLQAARGLLPAGTVLHVRTLHGIPLYDADLEAAAGIPPEVEALKAEIAGAHGLLIATPEYNASLPGVLKNALDWLSRPPQDVPRVFLGKAVGLLGATPGRLGTALAQNAWLPVLWALRTRPFFAERIHLAGADQAFAGDGSLADPAFAARLRQYLLAFRAHVQPGGAGS